MTQCWDTCILEYKVSDKWCNLRIVYGKLAYYTNKKKDEVRGNTYDDDFGDLDKQPAAIFFAFFYWHTYFYIYTLNYTL